MDGQFKGEVVETVSGVRSAVRAPVPGDWRDVEHVPEQGGAWVLRLWG
jgi:hypothetical protein